MNRSNLAPIVLAAALLAGFFGAAAADSANKDVSNQEEIAAVLSAKTSLAQAIATAEQQTGGKAVSSGLDNQSGAVAYEVETVKGSDLQTVLIDLTSGQVITVMAGEVDDEHDDD